MGLSACWTRWTPTSPAGGSPPLRRRHSASACARSPIASDRVRELTGYRADDPAQAFTLQVAVLGARLLGWREPAALTAGRRQSAAPTGRAGACAEARIGSTMVGRRRAFEAYLHLGRVAPWSLWLIWLIIALVLAIAEIFSLTAALGILAVAGFATAGHGGDRPAGRRSARGLQRRVRRRCRARQTGGAANDAPAPDREVRHRGVGRLVRPTCCARSTDTRVSCGSGVRTGQPARTTDPSSSPPEATVDVLHIDGSIAVVYPRE